MFKKLKTYHSIPDWNKIKGEYIHGYDGFDCFDIKDLDYFNNFFDPLISFNLKPIKINCIEIRCTILPHIDTYPFTAVVNFVVDSAQATTSYYCKKPDAVFENDILYGTGNFPPIRKYDLDNKLELVDSFTSKEGEFILLDVSKVHDVKIEEPKIRKLITWRWCHFSADHLLKHINFLF